MELMSFVCPVLQHSEGAEVKSREENLLLLAADTWNRPLSHSIVELILFFRFKSTVVQTRGKKRQEDVFKMSP